MNDSNSPLPQPSGATCPNCGAAQSAHATHCTDCGAPLRVAAPGSLSNIGKTIASIALAFGALAFGALGGCLAILSRIEGGSFDAASLLIVGVPILLVIACVWAIFRIQRK